MKPRKVVVIHQPDFVPHLAFFHRLLLIDLFIVLDDVQFLRRGWHHRDKIKTAKGEKWLTVPVQKGQLNQKINEVLVCGGHRDWGGKLLRLLEVNYHAAPYYELLSPPIEKIFFAGHRRLIDLNMSLLRFFFQLFDLKVQTVFSSELAVAGRKNDKLLNLVAAVGGSHYLTGTGSRAYLDEKLFSGKNISVLWQKFNHPVYPQVFEGFLPYLSCLDFAMNCGGNLRKYLQAGGNELTLAEAPDPESPGK